MSSEKHQFYGVAKKFFTSNLLQDFFQLKNPHSVKATSVHLSKNNLCLKAIQQKKMEKKKNVSNSFQKQSLKKKKSKGKNRLTFCSYVCAQVFLFVLHSSIPSASFFIPYFQSALILQPTTALCYLKILGKDLLTVVFSV